MIFSVCCLTGQWCLSCLLKIVASSSSCLCYIVKKIVLEVDKEPSILSIAFILYEISVIRRESYKHKK